MANVKFTKDHEWARMEADGTVVVGITDYAQEQLGDLVFVSLPEVGRELAAGEEAAAIESVKAAGDIKSPLAGTVVTVNEALADDPGAVNSDPMGSGWFYTLRPDNAADLDALMDESAYQALLAD